MACHVVDWGGQAPPQASSHSQMPQTTDIAELAEYSAGLYARNTEEHATFVQYYTQYYTQQQEQVRSTQHSCSITRSSRSR